MAAPKGNSNAAKGGIEKTLRIRFADEDALNIALDLSPAERGRAMGEWHRLQYLLKSAMQIIMEYTDHENTPVVDLVLNEIDAYFIHM